MNARFLARLGVVAIVIAALPRVALDGQTPAATKATSTTAKKSLAPPKLAEPAKAGWSPPRTPDGHPDLQGTWTNGTITPFERPADLANKPFLTDQEAAELEQRAAKQRAAADGPPPKGSVGTYNQFWFDAGTKVVSTKQASLVVDPPDGRVPLTKAAEQKRDANLARSTDSPEFMSVWDRCITRGVPGSMFPAGYNNAYQIFQMPGYVVILYEMIHDARVIPMDGRPHLPSNVRFWMGDARGRWEGDTLVVDTTNFTDKGWIASSAAAGRIKGIPQSEALHVVERFKLLDATTIGYEVTIEDPNVYTRPWKVAIPLTRDPGYEIYEYACHEGNHAVEGVLKGARLLEKEAAETGTSRPSHSAQSGPSLAPAGALRLQQAGSSAATTPSSLDFDMFRTRVQPILTSPRKGNARCIACHSRGGGNSYLEPLAPGSTTYTEEQTRRTFERVQRLVVPGEPLKSPLLVNPLAEEAGGSHWHGGGKHWSSQDHPEWQTLAAWVRTKSAGPAATGSSAASASSTAAISSTTSASPAATTTRLDFEIFRTRVQPILTSPRKGNARCIACHSRGGGNSYLEPLSPGSTTYTEEQSRRNFERVQRLVIPGEPLKSPLLVNPLAEEAGGSHWHGGGKHWTSQDHPEWRTLAAWVRGN